MEVFSKGAWRAAALVVPDAWVHGAVLHPCHMAAAIEHSSKAECHQQKPCSFEM